MGSPRRSKPGGLGVGKQRLETNDDNEDGDMAVGAVEMVENSERQNKANVVEFNDDFYLLK